MSERSVEIWSTFREASEKFDYFVTGFTGALAAYIGEQLKPVRLGANPQTLEVLALALLVISIVLGFLRIERTILMLSLNHQRLYQLERRGTMVSLLASGQDQINVATGELWAPEHAAIAAEDAKSTANSLEEHLERQKKIAFRAYRWRNRFLLAGFIALVAARILAAYV